MKKIAKIVATLQDEKSIYDYVKNELKTFLDDSDYECFFKAKLYDKKNNLVTIIDMLYIDMYVPRIYTDETREYLEQLGYDLVDNYEVEII